MQSVASPLLVQYRSQLDARLLLVWKPPCFSFLPLFLARLCSSFATEHRRPQSGHPSPQRELNYSDSIKSQSSHEPIGTSLLRRTCRIGCTQRRTHSSAHYRPPRRTSSLALFHAHDTLTISGTDCIFARGAMLCERSNQACA